MIELGGRFRLTAALLIEHGAHTTQIDVRAFGNRPDAGSPDRVDIVAPER